MRNFIRNIEDFTCANCGFFVSGNGYTNHCPKCLYSLHVDNNPGDRLNNCGGLMKPISFEKKDDEERVIHECAKCKIKKPNKLNANDNFDVVLGL